MLVDARTLLAKADMYSYAVGAFNTYNLEITLGILRAAEARNAPVILQVSASALSYGGISSLSELALVAAKEARIPVAVHLDHAHDFNLLQTCLDLGYTSVMYDGSAKPLQENISSTYEAAKIAHEAGVPIEAELGAIVGEENSHNFQSQILPYTDPDQAEVFVKATTVDSLAVAIGNIHGFYKLEPNLDFERLAMINKRVKVPLVLHGASGISKPDIQLAIQLGIRKINVNTELRRAFFQTLAEHLTKIDKSFNLPRIMNPAIEAVEKVVSQKIDEFGFSGQA